MADRQIQLWEGTPLEETHRHHSHLAGITPFEVIDPADPACQQTVRNSIRHWIKTGMGLWTGWCRPWAVQLHTQAGNADMAEMLLEMCQRVFTNQGHGTLHDCEFSRLTLMGDEGSDKKKKHEIMQMDAGMGVVTAITDLLLQSRGEVHYLFAGCPSRWSRVSFTNLLTAGGFLVSAERVDGKINSVNIQATRAGTFYLADPETGKVRSIQMESNEIRILTA